MKHEYKIAMSGASDTVGPRTALSRLADEVSEALLDGWVPHGPVFVMPNTDGYDAVVAQALTRLVLHKI